MKAKSKYVYAVCKVYLEKKQITDAKNFLLSYREDGIFLELKNREKFSALKAHVAV